jgi:hypothetical protein
MRSAHISVNIARMRVVLSLLLVSCATANDPAFVPSADSAIDTRVIDSTTTPGIDSTVAADTGSADTGIAMDSTTTMETSTPVDSTLVDTAEAAVDTGGGDSGVLPATWTTDTKPYSCTIGARYTYDCPPAGTASTVWGSGPYTDDSSLCTAAVHAGVITLASGGLVTIEVRAGESSYASSTANGITTTSYGSWTCSFAIVGSKLDGGVPDAGPPAATWSTTAKDHECKIGESFKYTCPGSGMASSVWGSGPYTHDSSICTAAVHAGKITLATGGAITIEMRAGEASYSASTANGITTLSYGSWTCSFVLL